MSAPHGYAVEATRQNVGRGGHAADVGGPRGRQRPIGPLGTPQAEFQDRAACGRLDDPSRLRGHERLEADHVQQDALHELGLEKRSAHAKERFAGEDYRALSDGVDVAGEAQARETVEELRNEERLPGGPVEASQVVDVDRIEAQALEHSQRVVETGHYGVAAAKGKRPETEREDCVPVSHAGAFVTGAHRQLIQVRERSQTRAIELRYAGHSALDSTVSIASADEIARWRWHASVQHNGV